MKYTGYRTNPMKFVTIIIEVLRSTKTFVRKTEFFLLADFTSESPGSFAHFQWH